MTNKMYIKIYYKVRWDEVVSRTTQRCCLEWVQTKMIVINAGVKFPWSGGTAILALENFKFLRAPQQFKWLLRGTKAKLKILKEYHGKICIYFHSTSYIFLKGICTWFPLTGLNSDVKFCLTWSQFTYSMALDAYHIDSVNTCYD